MCFYFLCVSLQAHQSGANTYQVCIKLKKKSEVKVKFIPYLHQGVSAGAHECVHHTIKGVVVRISSHVTHSFTWGEKWGSVNVKHELGDLISDRWVETAEQNYKTMNQNTMYFKMENDQFVIILQLLTQLQV